MTEQQMLLKKIMDDAEKEINGLSRAIDAILRVINPNGSIETTTGFSFNLPKYKAEWSMRNKIKYFFQQEQHFLHSRNFVELIKSKEPNSNVTTRQFSIALNMLQTRPKPTDPAIRTHRVGDDRRNTFWGLEKWYDDVSKKPKDEHMFDKKDLWINVKEEIKVE